MKAITDKNGATLNVGDTIKTRGYNLKCEPVIVFGKLGYDEKEDNHYVTFSDGVSVVVENGNDLIKVG